MLIFSCILDRNRALIIVMTGPTLATGIVMVILSSKIKLWLIDYSVLCFILVRCLVTWMIFKYKLEDKPVSGAIDIKELLENVLFIFVPSMLGLSTNWRVDFLLTGPIALIATFITIENADNPENGNMDCND